MLRRYLLFGGGFFYPLGGFKDLVDSFDSIDEARGMVPLPGAHQDYWYQIVDLESRSIVEEGTCDKAIDSMTLGERENCDSA